MSYIYSPNSGATISQNLPMTPKKLPLLNPTHFITATNASQMEGEGHATGSLPSQNQLKITWCFQVQIVLRLLQFPSKQETQNKLSCACFEANCSMPRTIWTWKRSQIRLPNAVWISFFACALLTFLCTHRGVPSFCVVPWKTSILSPCPRPQVNDELHRNFPHFDACNVWINLYIYIYILKQYICHVSDILWPTFVPIFFSCILLATLFVSRPQPLQHERHEDRHELDFMCSLGHLWTNILNTWRSTRPCNFFWASQSYFLNPIYDVHRIYHPKRVNQIDPGLSPNHTNTRKLASVAPGWSFVYLPLLLGDFVLLETVHAV